MQSPLLRSLGNLERWSAIRHTLGYYNSVTLAIALCPRAASSLTLENVYAALNNCLAAHAVLSVTIVDDTHFARVPDVDLSKIVTFHDVMPELAGQLGEEASHGFGDGGAGVCWRMSVYPKERRVFFSYHHGIMDGEAGIIIMRSFVAALLSPTPIDTTTTNAYPELLPPIEQLLPLSVSWTTLFQKLTAALLPSWFPTLRTPLWIGAPIVLGRFPTRVKLLQLDAEATEQLRRRCRQENTSVTALISAAVAMAIMRGAGEGIGVAGSIIISLRRYLPRGAAQPVGVMATNVDHTHYPPSAAPGNDIWQRAREVKATITAGLASGPGDCKIALLAYAPDIRGYLLSQQGKLRELGFEVSNLGVVKIDGVEEMVFSQSASPVGNAFHFSVVATEMGGLRVAVPWLEDGGVDASWIEGLVERLECALEEAIRI